MKRHPDEVQKEVREFVTKALEGKRREFSEIAQVARDQFGSEAVLRIEVTETHKSKKGEELWEFNIRPTTSLAVIGEIEKMEGIKLGRRDETAERIIEKLKTKETSEPFAPLMMAVIFSPKGYSYLRIVAVGQN